MTLDLNGKKLAFDDAEEAVIHLSSAITLNLENGTLDGRIQNYSTSEVNISNATITGARPESSGAAAIYNGNGTIEGGTVVITNSTVNNLIDNYGNLTFTGSSVTGGKGISNYSGTLTINGNSTINATTESADLGGSPPGYYGVYNNNGTVNFESSTITSKSVGIYNEGANAKVEVKSGAVTGNKTVGIYNLSGGAVTVSGGTVTGQERGIEHNSTGTLSISGGTVTGTTQTGVVIAADAGSANITGGTIVGGGYFAALDNRSTSNITISAASITGAAGFNNGAANSVTITNATIEGTSQAGLTNNGGGSVTFSSGSITGGGGGINNGANSTVSVAGGTIGATGGYGGIVNSGRLDVSDGTITGVSGYGAITNMDANAAVSIGGGSISGTNAIYNVLAGNVTVSGGTLSGDTYGIYNYAAGNIAVSGGTLSGGTNGVYNYAAGNATISGGSISGSTNAVRNNSTGNVTISGGSLTGGGTAVLNYGAGSVLISDGTIEGTSYAVQNRNNTPVSITGGTFSKALRSDLNFVTANNGYSITGGSFDTFNYDTNSKFLVYTPAGTNLRYGVIGVEGWNGTSNQNQYFYLNATDSINGNYGSSVVSLAGVQLNGYESVGVDTANSVFAVPTAVTLSAFATTGSQYQFLQYNANRNTASELKSDAAIVIDTDKLFGTTVTKIDGSENAQAMSIVGGNNVTEITGGTAADSLIAGSSGAKLDGGKGDNTLTGGAGADTFVFSGGKNLIKGYNSESDIVNLDSAIDPVTNGASISSDDNGFTIGFSATDSLTFDNKDAIAQVRSGGQLYTYSKDAITLNKGVTLTAGASSYSLGSDNTYNAVNATASTVEAGVSLGGNAYANTLTAGNHGSNLNGGLGNDNLYGGNGADVFVYGEKSGKDAIYGYGATDSLNVNTDKIVSGNANANSGDLVFKIDNSNSITFKSADDGKSVEKILLAGGTDSLTKDGVIGSADSILTVFSEQKGKVDLKDSIYGGVAGINASKVTKNAITMAGGATGGTFTFAANKKADVFEYGGGTVSLSSYETGTDKIDLGAASLQSFSVDGTGVSLSTDKGVISIGGAQEKEILLHDATGKNNSFTKMIFAANGVLYDKEKNPTAVILSAGAGGADSIYTANSAVKKITVGSGVSAISVRAGDKNNTIIDASGAGAGVTLIGGDKNDKFTGREGADTFVYTKGKDVITNYESGDTITLDGAYSLGAAKITQSRKSVTLKFDNKNSLAIKSDDAIGAINIGGVDYTFGKNAVIQNGVASLTSEFSGTYKVGSGVSVVSGAAIEKKNYTMQGTSGAELLTAGGSESANNSRKKVTFKGGGGADSLVGGASKDTFFYARNDTGATTVDYFDYANDNIKIKRTLTDINKTGAGLVFEMGDGNTLTLKTDNKNNNIGSSNVLIKANNTLYWFEGSGDDYGLYTAKDKDSKSAIKSVLRSKSDYSIVDLNYSTNLVKAKVADVTETVFTSAMAENYKIK